MNQKLFKKRLNDLYICWRNHKKDLWGNSDMLVIHTPPPSSSSSSSSSLCNPISSFFFFWLIGHDLPDTTAVFTSDEIHFICNNNSNSRKISILQTLAGPALEAVKARVLIHSINRGDDGLAAMDDVIRGVRARCDGGSVVVGCVSGESPISRTEYRFAPVNRGFAKLSKVFNMAVRGSGNSNGREIQMQSLPDDFEQRLWLGGEMKPRDADGLVPNAEQKEPVLEKEKSVVEELSEYGLVSEEEDEWVLIEADEQVQHQNGKRNNKRGLLRWTK